MRQTLTISKTTSRKSENRIFLSPFLIKLLHWEFWPIPLIYAPVFIYYLWLALKSRSWFFFSMVNPDMETGGLYGASKYRQLNKLPDRYKPLTLLISPEDSHLAIIEQLQKIQLSFPLIVKPDKAERGTGIEKIENREALSVYLNMVKAPFLIQEYIDFPFEAGVFYYRMPGQKKGKISSVVIKDFLTVIGDGRSSMAELMNHHYRSCLLKKKMIQKLGKAMDRIPDSGEEILLEPIGNHNRGTAFLNGNHLITTEQEAVFDNIAAHLPEFYYGRFDLRAPSPEALQKGESIKIMEVNGVNAEPAHIYHPGASLLSAWATLLKHWSIIGWISRENGKRGHHPMDFQEALGHYREWRESCC